MITIDGFIIDAVITEEISYDSEVTDHPTEEGGDISDHVAPRPTVYTIEAVVSDSPIGEVKTARAAVGAGEGSFPTRDARAKLLAIRAARKPIVIETPTDRFESMVLQSLSMPRDGRTGVNLRFRASFKQVRVVTNNRVTVRVAVPRAAKKQNLGNKPTEDVPILNQDEEANDDFRQRVRERAAAQGIDVDDLRE